MSLFGNHIITLRQPNLREIKVLFDTGFTVVIIILFSVWSFNCFKKLNFLHLIDQIKDTRIHSLSVKDTIYLLFALCCAAAVLILLNFNFFFWDHHKAKAEYFKILLRVLYINVSWALIMNTSFSSVHDNIIRNQVFHEMHKVGNIGIKGLRRE